MIKVLQVIDRLEVGGAERVFLDLVVLLRSEGVPVDVLTISGKGEWYKQIDNGCLHYFLNRTRKFSIVKLRECANICNRYDIVHVHMRYTYTYVRLVQILFRCKFKLVFQDHFGDIDKNQKVPIGLRLIFKPSYYIGVSESLEIWALKTLNLSRDRVWVLRNTIIPTKKVVLSHTIRENRIIMVSNIRRTKNIDFAIDLALRYNFSLDIYGNIVDWDYARNLQEKIKNSNNIKIISGVSEIQPLLINYKMAIHSAESESGPLVLMEYLANGIPFLAYGTGEIYAILKSKTPEFFTHNFSFEDWYERIEMLKCSEWEAKLLKELFNKYFGPETYIKKCLKIYQEIIAS